MLPARQPSLGSAAVALAALLAACAGGTRGGSTLTVFAAASLSGPFGELAAGFEASHAGVDVVTNFAGSSALAAQIGEGAPADVFAAADLESVETLVADGLVAEPVVFATNRLAIAVERGNPLRITGVADLADPELVLALCAPEVPCGAYAADVFARAGVTPHPATWEEHVKGVLTKVAAGEADAGIVYATDVVAGAGQVDGVPVDPALQVVAEYPITRVSGTADAALAQAFVDHVLSDAGRAVLAAHGFGVPG